MSGWRAAAVGLGATVCFGAALGLREQVNVWLSMGAASVVSGTLAMALAGRTLWPLVHTDRRSVGIGLLAGGLLALGTRVLYLIAVPIVPGLADEVARLYAPLEAWPGPVGGLVVLAATVVVEEMVWRGVLLQALLERVPRAAAGAVAIALYAVPQLATSSWLLVAAAVGFGAVWTVQRLRTDGLTEPLLCHLVWSTAVFGGGLLAP